MTRKSRYKVNSFKLTAALMILLFIIIVGIIVWKKHSQKPPQVNDTRPDIENVLTLEGKVTMKFRSCGAKSLYPNEDVSDYTVCDSGQGIRVDNKIIYTASAGPQINSFQVDIDSINLGDNVIVRYVVDEDYERASLNCKKCFIAPL